MQQNDDRINMYAVNNIIATLALRVYTFCLVTLRNSIVKLFVQVICTSYLYKLFVQVICALLKIE